MKHNDAGDLAAIIGQPACGIHDCWENARWEENYTGAPHYYLSYLPQGDDEFLCLPVVARLPCFSFIVFLVGLDMVFRVSHNSILETRHGEIISYKVPRVFDEFQSVDRMR